MASPQASRGPRPPAGRETTTSASKRVGRKNRVVEDHGLRFNSEEADFQFLPEVVGIGAGLAVPEPVEPAASLVVVPETVFGAALFQDWLLVFCSACTENDEMMN